MMYDVVTIGSATHDVLVNVKAAKVIENDEFSIGKSICLPFGSKVLIDKLVMTSGGGGTNAAVTFARQGFHTACISLVGNDANGREVLDEMRREKVDAKWFQIRNDDRTAYSLILVGPAGERTILSYKGEGMYWDVESIPWDNIDAKWLYINSLSGHLELLARVTKLAADKGMHLASNPGSKEIELGLEKLAPLWKSFDIIGMNQEEAADLTGLDFKDEEAIFKKLDDVIGGIFIMTKGNEGCVVSDGQFGIFRRRAPG